jgi:hypothetical protein
MNADEIGHERWPHHRARHAPALLAAGGHYATMWMLQQQEDELLSP